MKKLFKRSDIFIILIVLILSFLLFVPNLFNNDSLTAQIYVYGETVKEIELSEISESFTFSPKDGTEITVSTGKICFSNAKCADELCIKSGWLTSKGQTAACLPEKVVITIKGSDKTDMMTY